MPISPPTCPKCQSAMEQGFILDHGDHGHARVTKWGRGRPRKSWMFGTHQPSGDPLPIGTYRCARCGYLEQYASEEFAAE